MEMENESSTAICDLLFCFILAVCIFACVLLFFSVLLLFALLLCLRWSAQWDLFLFWQPAILS